MPSKKREKKWVGRCCCVCVWGPARARERDWARESSHIQSTRRGTWVLNWYDMMQLLSFSIIFQHTHSPSFFFPPLPADCRPAAPSLPCVCHPSLYTVVVVVALYPTNTTNKEKIETLCREKRWNWIEFSCRPGVLYITAFLSNNNITHTHTHTEKRTKKKKKIGKEKKSIGCWEIEYMW